MAILGTGILSNYHVAIFFLEFGGLCFFVALFTGLGAALGFSSLGAAFVIQVEGSRCRGESLSPESNGFRFYTPQTNMETPVVPI